MLVLPTTFQFERGLLLAGLVAGGLISASTRWSVSRDILMLWLLTLTEGAFGIFWGYINGAPGALRVSTVYLVWPIVYILFVGLVRSPSVIVFFEKTLILGIVVSSMMMVVLLVSAVTGQSRIASEIFAFQGAAIGLYDGFIELRLFNLTTVIYGLPYLAMLFFLPRVNHWLKSRMWVGLALLLVLLVCVASGRRVFWLEALVTPVLVWGLLLLANVRASARSVGIAVIFIAIIIAGVIGSAVNFNALSEQLLSAFDFSGEYSASIRYQQYVALISEWSDSPLIGQGLGASANSFIRSKEQPWAYELSYVALLFQAGLLGIIIYSSAVLWILYKGIKLVRLQPDAAQVILPLLAGLAGFLFVNATNPYLLKLDYLLDNFSASGSD